MDSTESESDEEMTNPKVNLQEVQSGNEIKYKCKICFKLISHKNNLNRHLQMVHSIANQCPYCPRIFKEKGQYQKHLNTHGSYQCEYCEKRFMSEKHFLCHIALHTGEKNLKCSVCLKTFKHVKNLKQHAAVHTNERIFKCDMCFKNYKTYAALCKHKEIHEDNSKHQEDEEMKMENVEGSLVCPCCFEVFNEKSELEMHIQISHEQFSYPSSETRFVKENRGEKHSTEDVNHVVDKIASNELETVSGINGASESQLPEFQMIEIKKECNESSLNFDNDQVETNKLESADILTNNTNFEYLMDLIKESHVTCPVCLKGFQDNVELIYHVKIHATQENFECLNCSMQFACLKSLIDHNDEVHEDECKCNFCEKTFTSLSELELHVKAHSDTGGSKYECSICNKTFYKQQYLKRHFLVHSENFKCSLCPESFNTSTKLEKHLNSHFEETKQPCDICSETFTTYQALQDHLKTHLGEKPYKSKTFSKSFYQQSGEESNNPKPAGYLHPKIYKCEHCEKSFSRRANLSKHLAVHMNDTKEKKLKCSHCETFFECQTTLNKHEETVHLTNKVKFQCPYCNKRFFQWDYIRKHNCRVSRGGKNVRQGAGPKNKVKECDKEKTGSSEDKMDECDIISLE